MAALLKLQFIIFSLIAIGFFTRRRGMVSREGQKNITDLVINLILPCNILTSFSQQFAEGTMHECLMVFLISAGKSTKNAWHTASSVPMRAFWEIRLPRASSGLSV